jgi:hypothetical protein
MGLREKARATAFRVVVFLTALVSFSRLCLSELSFSIRQLLLEAPLVAALYLALRGGLRGGRWASVAAALPFFSGYVLFDVHYTMLGRVPRITDLRNLPELYEVLPFWPFGGLMVVAAIPSLLWVSSIDRRRGGYVVAAGLAAIMLVMAIEKAPRGVLAGFERIHRVVREYSDAESVQFNGRFVMLLYFEARRRATDLDVAEHRNRARYDERMSRVVESLRPHLRPANVHLIVLESFVDPSLLENVRFSAPPAHPEWRERYAPHLGLSRSPVFGGNTAQAEFEVLCGVPALRRLAGIEFNLFTGARAWCLPGILSELGFRASASNPFKPHFFNAWNAYQGAGFEDIHFPREFMPSGRSYLSVRGVRPREGLLFDGDLFEQNLGFLAGVGEREPRPVLNYVLGIYGHHPHGIDSQLRPRRVRVVGTPTDPMLDAVVDQFHHRTGALARYLDALRERDPQSIIVVISDHLPHLLGGRSAFQELGYLGGGAEAIYENRVLIYSRGRFLEPPRTHHHEIPRIILDELTDGWYCTTYECGHQEPEPRASFAAHVERYLDVMSHATE